MAAKPRTLGELRSSGYKVQTVKQEMRRNLIAKMRKGEDLFPGILGFEETVIPQLQNAILSGQDIIFLGERGQAKSRLIRSLVNLLDDEIPIVAGSEVNDDPFNPISKLRAGPDRRAGRQRRRSSGSAATAATARSSPRRTSRSPT